MPWSETCPMEQRIRFVLEALEGWDSMSEPCARYGISRRVGYKWLDRYRREGLEGLADRSRAPHRQRAATSPDVVEAIVALRKEHPTWGPPEAEGVVGAGPATGPVAGVQHDRFDPEARAAHAAAPASDAQAQRVAPRSDGSGCPEPGVDGRLQG